MRKLRVGTVQRWFSNFVEALDEAHASSDPEVPVGAGPSPVWPVRSSAPDVSAGCRVH